MRLPTPRPWHVAAAAFIGGLLLYVQTLAPSVVFGDPAEYTFVPYVWGVLHPPGYAFYTLLAKAWQTLVPIGTVAYRTNLLSAVAAASTLGLVATTVFRILGGFREATRSPAGVDRSPIPSTASIPLAALFAAAVLAVAPNFWQHAIHANAKTVTATLAALALYLLLHWRPSSPVAKDRWLMVFALVAGLGITHHPLIVFSFPGFAVFILSVRPGIYRDRRTLLRLAVSGLVGLTPWLYLPIRASLEPPLAFGPSNLNTVKGFLDVVLARGLTMNLFHFGMDEQWLRVIAFWSLLRMQFWLPVIALIAVGFFSLWRRDLRAGAMTTVFLAVNLWFILNTVQDVMAYFIVPQVGLAILAGVGAWEFTNWVSRAVTDVGQRLNRRPASGAGERSPWVRRSLLATSGLPAALLLIPILGALHHYPRVTLRNATAADAFLDRLSSRFEGRGEGASMLLDWEHFTPLMYRRFTTGKVPDPADYTPVFVSGGERAWVDHVWKHVEDGPIYVVEFQPQIIAEGFRLRADGLLYRVLPPPAKDVPAIPRPLPLVAGGQIEVLGYDLGRTTARAGDVIPFALYLRVPRPVSDILFPNATLGPYTYHWTTDSHLLTPYWQAGEVIVERFDLVIPLDAAGDLPLSLGVANLATGTDLAFADGRTAVPLTTIRVEPNPAAPAPVALDALAANFGQRVGLESAWVLTGGHWHAAPWAEPITARPGQALRLFLQWRALAPNETSLTVFLHLLDPGNGLWIGQDYTPLGGSYPTMYWFPKWLEGQTVLDPYSLLLPPDLPPGDYYLEVGLYGLRTVQRVPAFDRTGNLEGDRFVLGWLRVQP